MKITFNPSTKTQSTSKDDRWIQNSENNFVYLYGVENGWEVKVTYTRKDGVKIANMPGTYDVDPDGTYCYVMQVPTQAVELSGSVSVSILINEPDGDDFVRHATIDTAGHVHPNKGVVIPKSLEQIIITQMNNAINNINALKLDKKLKGYYIADVDLGVSGGSITTESFVQQVADALSGGDYLFNGVALIEPGDILLEDLMDATPTGGGFAIMTYATRPEGLSSSAHGYLIGKGSLLGKDEMYYCNYTQNASTGVVATYGWKRLLNIDDLTNLTDGTTIVKKAEQDDEGNNILDTYETKANATTERAKKANLTGGNTFEGAQIFSDSITVNGPSFYNGLIYAYLGLDANGEKIKHVANPVDGTDGVNKQYVDTGLDTKADLVSGKVPSSQIPNSYDDVLEFDTYADLPETGEKGILYAVINDETQPGVDHSFYRWSGSVYVLMHDEMDPSAIKTLYESNTNTNAFTDALKLKLNNLPSDVFSEDEINFIISNLMSVYGLSSTNIATLNSGNGVSISGYNNLLFVVSNNYGWSDTQKVSVPHLVDNQKVTFTVKDDTIVLGEAVIEYDSATESISFVQTSGESGVNLICNVIGYKNDKSQFYEIRNIEEQSITYLADGKVNQVIGDNVTTTPTYDEYGNITKITEVYALDGKTYETTFTRNSEGKIINTNKQEVI